MLTVSGCHEFLEASNGDVRTDVQVIEHVADLGETRVRAAQESDQLTCADLPLLVTPVTVVVHDCGAQQTDVVVDAQRLDRQARAATELPNRDQAR